MPPFFYKNSDNPRRPGNFPGCPSGLSKSEALAEARRCPQCHDPRCRQGCPLNIDIPGFIRLLREGDAAASLAKIKEQNELPGVCGRVCHAPCEKACVLKAEGKPIAVRALERYAADHGIRRNGLGPLLDAVLVRGVAMGPRGRDKWPSGARSLDGQKFVFQHRQARAGLKVAVAGSGPAGLSAAGYLVRKGYQVTVFEVFSSAGGILNYGIPWFRLPSSVLKTEIQALFSGGVQIFNHHLLGRTLLINDLSSQGFSCVLLAVGMGGPKFSDLPGANLARVYYAMEFLMLANSERMLKKDIGMNLGNRVAVFGGTSAALDCAGLCARLGKEATVIFEKTDEDMEVYPGERQQALKHGIRLEALTKPLRIVPSSDGGVAGVECVRVDFADPEETGAWRLVPVPDSQHVIEADSVIFAGSHKPGPSVVPFSDQLKLQDNGSLGVDENMMTSMSGVFAAGECVLGPGSVVDALASGKRTGASIDRYLREKQSK